jgi:hypothetical protein
LAELEVEVKAVVLEETKSVLVESSNEATLLNENPIKLKVTPGSP